MKTLLLLLLAQVATEQPPPVLPQTLAMNGQVAVLKLTADACKNPLGFGGATWHCEPDHTVKIRVPEKMTIGATAVTDSQGRVVAIIDVGMVAPAKKQKKAPARRTREGKKRPNR